MSKNTTIGSELTRATRLFIDSGIDTPQLDAEVLMAHVINQPRIHVIAHHEEVLNDEQSILFDEYVMRRAKREPLAYIIGSWEFWGLDFEVDNNVLVPRADTETLVEVAMAGLKGTEPIAADIGVGSGCIAISLASELPNLVIYGTELSPKTAEIAHRNALKHGVEIQVPIFEGNLLEPLPEELKGKLDAVISNPPYIPSVDIEDLQPEVRDFEPRGALDGGVDGLDCIAAILDASIEYLKPGGWVHLEIGIGEAEAVSDYARKAGYTNIRVTKDLNQIERVVSAQWEPLK